MRPLPSAHHARLYAVIMCLVSFVASGSAIAQSRQETTCIKRPAGESNFGAGVEDDGRTWDLVTRGGTILGKVVLSCRVAAAAQSGIAIVLAEIKTSFCVGDEVQSLAGDIGPCRIEQVIAPTNLPGLDQLSDAERTLLVENAILWGFFHLIAAATGALYRRTLRSIVVWTTVAAGIAGLLLSIGLAVPPGFPVLLFPAAMLFGTAAGSLLGLGYIFMRTLLRSEHVLRLRDDVLQSADERSVAVTRAGGLLLLIAGLYGLGWITFVVVPIASLQTELDAYEVVGLVVPFCALAILTVPGLAIVLRWRRWRTYAGAAAWLNTVVGALAAFAYLVGGLTGRVGRFRFFDLGVASMLLALGLVLLRVKRTEPPELVPQSLGSGRADAMAGEATLPGRRLDAHEACYRAIYPVRLAFSYQAQAIICYWLFILPVFVVWRIPLVQGWWLPQFFGGETALLVTYVLMTFIWLLGAAAIRNCLKVGAVFALVLAAVLGLGVVQWLQIVRPLAAATTGFAGSAYPLLALGPAVLFFLSVAGMLYPAVVLVWAAINLLSATSEQRGIMREARGGFSWPMAFLVRMLGFPISLEYARKPLIRYAALIVLSLLSSFAMSVVVLSALVVLPSSGFDGFVSLWQQCQVRANCYDIVGFVTFIAPTVGVAMLTLIVFAIGGGTQKLIRRLLRISLERLQQIDRRAPVVFLRAFRDDQIPLRPPRLGLMGRVMDVGRRRTSLDEMLLEEVTSYGPAVALGNPRDGNPPYGAARAYFDTNSWQQAVAELVHTSSSVVVCIDDTEGIWWEIDHIVDQGHLAKTLFLIHPKYSGPQANAALISKLVSALRLDHAAVAQLQGDASTPGGARGHAPIIGFYADDRSALRILESETFSRFAYLLATRTFMRRELSLAP